MIPASNFTHHVSRAHYQFVRKEYDFARKSNFDNFIIMSQTISFNEFFQLLFLGLHCLCWKLKELQFAIFVTG